MTHLVIELFVFKKEDYFTVSVSAKHTTLERASIISNSGPPPEGVTSVSKIAAFDHGWHPGAGTVTSISVEAKRTRCKNRNRGIYLWP